MAHAAALAAPRSPASAATGSARSFSIMRDPIRIALMVLIVLTVSRIHQQYPVIAKLRPAMLLTFITALYAFLNPRYLTTGSIMRAWPTRVIVALVVLACLSVPFGISMGNSGKFILEIYSKNVILALLIIAAVRHHDDLYTFAYGYTIGCGLLAVLALFVFKLQTYGRDFSYSRLSGLHAWDANDVGCVLLVGMPLALLVLQLGRPLHRIVALLTIIGIGGTIARSGSRGGFIGLLAVGVALLVLASSVSVLKRILIVAMAVVALAFWAPPGYWQQMQTIAAPKEDYNWSSKDGRKELMKRGMGYMWSRPFFGVGINNFTKAECTISEKAKTTQANTYLRCTPPHNSFVQAGAELGVPGLLLWAGLLLGGVPALLMLRARMPRRWRRGTREERFAYAFAGYLAVACVGFAATSFFLTFAWLEIYYVLAAFMAGLYFCVERLQQGDRATPGLPHPASRVEAPRSPEWRTRRWSGATLAAASSTRTR